MADEKTEASAVCSDCAKRFMRNYADATGCDRFRGHSKCAESTIAKLRAEVEAFRARVAEREWIPCRDRLPSSAMSIYFVTWFEGKPELREGRFGLGRFCNFALFEWEPDEVSHWMPMPREPAPNPPSDPESPAAKDGG